MARVGGQGLSKGEISVKYATWKSRWVRANRRLSPADARVRMNETLCTEIAEARVRAEAEEARRRAASRRAFFAGKAAPRGWSLVAHREQMPRTADGTVKTFKFRLPPTKGNRRGVAEDFEKDQTERLLPGQWFNDNIVNAYLALLGSEQNKGSTGCIFLNSEFFHKFMNTDQGHGRSENYVNKPGSKRHELVASWTRNKDTTGPVRIFIPINHVNSHWSLIVVDVATKKIISMDSFGGSLLTERKQIMAWINAEHTVKNKAFVASQWTSENISVPQQGNGWDCGAFVCMFAAFMSNSRSLDFSQADMPKMRAKIAWSVLHTRL